MASTAYVWSARSAIASAGSTPLSRRTSRRVISLPESPSHRGRWVLRIAFDFHRFLCHQRRQAEHHEVSHSRCSKILEPRTASPRRMSRPPRSRDGSR